MNEQEKTAFVAGVIVGICIGTIICIGIFTYKSNQIQSLKENAIKHGAAEYVVNNADGTTVFVWKNNIKNKNGENK